MAMLHMQGIFLIFIPLFKYRLCSHQTITTLLKLPNLVCRKIPLQHLWIVFLSFASRTPPEHSCTIFLWPLCQRILDHLMLHLFGEAFLLMRVLCKLGRGEKFSNTSKKAPERPADLARKESVNRTYKSKLLGRKEDTLIISVSLSD